MSLRDQLQAIYDKNGRLTPQLVVTAAKSPKHPLHARFEWDDSKAAQKYRREQARDLIQSVKVRYQVGDESRDVRAYIAVPQSDSHQPSYTPVDDVIHDEFSRKLVLQDMEREWRTLRRRYDHFEEFTQLVLRDLGAA